MALFDGMVDPEQFDSGGGLLGRLMALPQFQGQVQPGGGADQNAGDQPTNPPASLLSPLLSDFGPSPGQPFSGSVVTAPDGSGHAAPPSDQAPSAPKPNATLAQSFALRPVGFPLPPFVIPGTPENQDYTHRAIGAARAFGNAIGNAVGSFLNNDDNPKPITPLPDATPLGGGRGGEKVPNLAGPPNSALPGGPGRIFITDENGKVVVDVTGERAKDIVPGVRAGPKRKPTPQELELLGKMKR